jgi:TetR/AcrR family transcriptional regulator, mexJK operon transcriptional repressor
MSPSPRSSTAIPKSAVPLAPRRPGRPKSENVAALTAHILDCAKALFFENGFGATTMEAISTQARVSKETLYSRFATKAMVLEAVLKAQFAKWVDNNANQPATADATSLEAAFRRHILIQIRVQKSYEVVSLSKLLASESHLFPDLAREVIETQFHYGVKLIADDIMKFAAIDGIPCKSPESIAVLLRGIVSGSTGSFTFSDKEMPAPEQEQLVERIIRLFMASRPEW